MRLFVVRHAEAAPGEPDELRPLTDAGRDGARALAATLAAEGVELVLSSPLLRARETAGDDRRRPPALDVEIDERLAPGATADAVRAAVDGPRRDRRRRRPPARLRRDRRSRSTGRARPLPARRRSPRSSSERRSRSAACASATATTRRSAGSTSRSRPARSSACSARTAPARRRRSRSSRATATATAATVEVLGDGPAARRPRLARADRRRAAVLVALPEPDRAREPARLRRLLPRARATSTR